MLSKTEKGRLKFLRKQEAVLMRSVKSKKETLQRRFDKGLADLQGGEETELEHVSAEVKDLEAKE